MKKKLLICFLLFSAPFTGIFAQCQADFTWMQTTNNVISFTNTSTGIIASTMYTWSFGDATYSGTVSPVHTYNIPGAYNVCLTITDSLGCNSTFCDVITVTGVIICNVSLTTTVTHTSCSTCTDGTASAVAVDGTPPYTYLWNISATTQTINNLASGTYTCCVTDANACTACSTVTVGASTCVANFTWVQTTNNTIAFTNTSTGTPASTDYYWSFGDLSVNYTQNPPAHYYALPDTYIVCLQIIDSLTFCSNIFCDTIIVSGVNCNNLTLAASHIDASCPTCSDGSASATPSGGNPPFTYLWNTLATTQTISNLAPGTYTCVITDALGCTANVSVAVGGNGGCSSNFTVTYVSPLNYNATNFATGAPPLSYIWSWGDATYSYTAFPTHIYAAAGFYTICLTITDALACTNTYCDSFYLARLETPSDVITVTVVPPGPSGIYSSAPENYCRVFPNPASDYLYIDYSLAASANTRITLYDVMGKILRSFTNDMSEGKHEQVFDIGSLEQGIYVLSLQSAHYSVTRTISTVK